MKGEEGSGGGGGGGAIAPRSQRLLKPSQSYHLKDTSTRRGTPLKGSGGYRVLP